MQPSERASEPGPVRWLDSHAHLDAAEFDPDRAAVLQRAAAAGVAGVLIPAVHPGHWDDLVAAASAPVSYPGAQPILALALGVHPMYVDEASAPALGVLAARWTAQTLPPCVVAVGECGLDGFVPAPTLVQQQPVLERQIRLAKAWSLPLVLHSRHAVDAVAALLRRAHFGGGGIAHAFAGSWQQACALLDLGLKLGLGGAMTHDRAQRLQGIARRLPPDAFVLETDAPDMAPAWLRTPGQPPARNDSSELPRIAALLAQWRGVALPDLAAQVWDNTLAALPRSRALWGSYSERM
ncbi:TatD family hydrolase [Amphibiibacter pelophylacis]|uniref:TatD family hydrolase n=1 Tax=Amphibiibacter pelophylacis TaxID=1799477 RepID=A0ACC6NZB8_9BURK